MNFNSKVNTQVKSLRTKLITAFGLLVFASSVATGFMMSYVVKHVVLHEVNKRMIDRATDTTTIIDSGILTVLESFKTMALANNLSDPAISVRERAISF